MRISGATPKPRLAIAMLLLAIFATLLQSDVGAVQQHRKLILASACASGFLLAYEASLLILKKNFNHKGVAAPPVDGISAKQEFLIMLLITALFATFLAVDHGIIYRLRAFNIVLLCLSAGLTVNAAWKIARKGK